MKKYDEKKAEEIEKGLINAAKSLYFEVFESLAEVVNLSSYVQKTVIHLSVRINEYGVIISATDEFGYWEGNVTLKVLSPGILAKKREKVKFKVKSTGLPADEFAFSVLDAIKESRKAVDTFDLSKVPTT